MLEDGAGNKKNIIAVCLHPTPTNCKKFEEKQQTKDLMPEKRAMIEKHSYRVLYT